MKVKIFTALLALAIAAIGMRTWLDTPEGLSDKPVVKIGVSLPLTGNSAEVGKANIKAITMALKDSPNTKYRYETFFEDDAVSPKQGLLNASNFADIKKVNAILTQWTPVGAVVAPLAESKKVIHFTCSFGDKVSEGDYNFNTFTSFAEQSRILAEKLKKEGLINIAYAVVNTSGCIEQSDFMIKSLKEQGFQFTDIEYYNVDEKDFRLLINKMEAKKPQYYLLCSLSPASQVFMRQFNEIVKKKNITSIDTFFEMNQFDYPLVDGLWFVNSAAGTKMFSAKYKSETDEELKSCSANLYDATKLLVWGYENTPVKEGAEIPTNEDVLKTLYSVKNYDGALGSKLYIDKNGVLQSQAEIKMIKDGKVVEVKG